MSKFDAKAELQNTPDVKKQVDILNNNDNLNKLEKLIDTVQYKNRTSYRVPPAEVLEKGPQPIDRVILIVDSFKKKIANLRINKTIDDLTELNTYYKNIFVKSIEEYLKEEAYRELRKSVISRIAGSPYGINTELVTTLTKPYIDALNKLKQLGYNDPKQIKQLTVVNRPANNDIQQTSLSSTTPDSSSTDQPPQDQQPCPKDKDDPISLIFNLLYFIGGIIASLLVVIIFVLATFDLLKYNITAISQYISLLNNPNMYNKDTQDFKALMYYRNSTDTEPYTIFGQQELIKLIFTLGTSVVGIVMIQVFILVFLLFVYKIIMKKPLEMGNIDFKQSAKPLGTVLIGVILAFIWSGLYHARFVNSIQPSIIYTHNNIEQVKNYIYDNLTTNEAFLTNLINGDITECTKIMNQQTNDNRIVRMIYTMSVYNFFKINISENEEAFNTVIRSIFTLPEIRVRSINPISYMYYNQNVFLPNLYPILRQYIFGTNKAISTSARDKIIRLDITQRINETNKRLMTLFKVPERKSQLRTYFYVAFAISLVFLFIVYALYREQISSLLGGDLLTKLKEIIMSVLSIKQSEEKTETISRNPGETQSAPEFGTTASQNPSLPTSTTPQKTPLPIGTK